MNNLYILENGKFYKLIHVTDYAKLKNISLSTVRVKRFRKVLKEKCMHLESGYYFITQDLGEKNMIGKSQKIIDARSRRNKK